MHRNDRKERFSMAYIAAVAAHAGFHVGSPGIDRDSVDGILMGDTGRRPRIEFQAKATARDLLGPDSLSFPLPIKNYDDLRTYCLVPRLLIVVVLPANDEDWLDHTEEALILRHCGYWVSLAGMPESANQTSVTVSIPRGQRFDPLSLKALMAKAQQEQTSCNSV